LNKATTSTDGIYFPKYVEGVPGVQPERIGPYSTTLNPGYDPNLPLYQPWPMFDAMRAANSDGRSAWSSYAEVDKKQYLSPENIEDKKYENVIFVGEDTCALKKIFISQGVIFVSKSKNMQKTLFVIDGSKMMASADKKLLVKGISKGADVWIWGPVPATISTYNSLLPLNMSLDSLVRSSFIPQPVSWTRGLNNSDFYFCELQKTPVARYTLKGKLVDEGNVMLEACRTDWRQWNKQPEPTKTATVLTSERECTAATPVMVRYRSGVSTFYISTLTNFTGSERGYKTFAALLKNAGVECSKVISNRKFVGRDKDYTFLEMPPSSTIEDKNDSMAPNPFVRSIFTADPSARVWKDGRLYVYCSHDIAPPRGCDLMDQYHVFSTDDMLHWTDHGEILRASQVPWGRKEGGFMWAPDCQYHKGKYYFFFPHPSETVTDHSWKVGVAVSKYPAKDFKVVGYIKGAPSYIDPCVFVDDDGQAYLYNGGGGVCMGGRLKSNLMEVDGEMDTMQGLRDFHEGTWVFKRNGKYYLTYADNYVAPNGRQANRLNYAIANSPLGPWKYQGIYLEPTDCDTSHGSVVEYRGQWYAFYHCCTLSGRGNLRSVCVDKLYFNSDGTIRMVKQRPRIK
jgi:arabinoxylan arabinofuranohydrolase